MNISRFHIVLIVFAIIIQPLIIGCDKKPTVASLSYEQEMINYISGTEEGRELYSLDLFPDMSEQFKDRLGYVVTYEFDSTRRHYDIDTSDIGGPADMYGFADIYDAVVRIDDTLYGKLNRIIGDSIIFYRYVKIAVTRYAYFLKLYTDDYSHRGWRFWGYGVDNLDPQQYGSFETSSGSSFSAFQSGDVLDVKSPLKNKVGFYFVFKNNMIKLQLGDSLTYRGLNRDILFAEKKDGIRHNINLISDGSNYIGGWRTPSGSDKFYRLITFEGPYFEKIDTVTVGGGQQIYTTRIRYSDVVIPFKVDI